MRNQKKQKSDSISRFIEKGLGHITYPDKPNPTDKNSDKNINIHNNSDKKDG